jgi:hypothetical protein
MRWFATFIFAAALFAAGSCASQPGGKVNVYVQDPCMNSCTVLYNRCVERSGGDAGRCGGDRAECEQECRADEATESGEDGVITTPQ